MLYFALPTIWEIMHQTVEWDSLSAWVSLSATRAPLLEGGMDVDAWIHLSVSVLICVAVPLVLGCWRLLHREVIPS